MIMQTNHSEPLLRRRHAIDIFVCTVAISIILHIAASILLFLPGRYAVQSVPPLFIDLKSSTLPPAADESLVNEPLPKEDAPVTEHVPLQETAPETAKLDKAIENSLRKAIANPDAVHESAIGLGMISGHFASFAEGESLKDDIRTYYFSLMRRINEVWWTGGTAKENFVSYASVNLMISREGKVVTCEFLQSSGNREQDQALLDSIRKAEPLPPLPSSYPRQMFNAPIRFVPPLRLMFPGFARKAASPH